MPAVGLQILAVTLAAMGWIFSIFTCFLPMWRVSAFTGGNFVTTDVTWEGIWMTCILRSTDVLHCEMHDTILGLDAELQAARALAIISIVMGTLGLLVATLGAKYTVCIEEERAKARVMMAAGLAFILAALSLMIPVSQTAHLIIAQFKDPTVPQGQKRDLGEALYLGWSAAAFLLMGGCILCSSCPQKAGRRHKPSSKAAHSQAKTTGSGVLEKQDYV
ncbi:claudin-4 [Nothobranchius furzeri]|uniref:Claudin-4-like n=1 Tax=Nothobranchius furzeri TaxID=105023 RepID=A0A9D3BTP7_NOTFU|nr:claudin-4 [Nothobranchius furzeri]KAF7218273.1 claudin-4-like [Nothobranchius furzeri]